MIWIALIDPSKKAAGIQKDNPISHRSSHQVAHCSTVPRSPTRPRIATPNPLPPAVREMQTAASGSSRFFKASRQPEVYAGCITARALHRSNHSSMGCVMCRKYWKPPKQAMRAIIFTARSLYTQRAHLSN